MRDVPLSIQWHWMQLSILCLLFEHLVIVGLQ